MMPTTPWNIVITAVVWCLCVGFALVLVGYRRDRLHHQRLRESLISTLEAIPDGACDINHADFEAWRAVFKACTSWQEKDG